MQLTILHRTVIITGMERSNNSKNNKGLKSTAAAGASLCAVPHGAIVFPCGSSAGSVSLDDGMLSILHFSKAFESSLELCRQNIFTMIMPSSRKAFSDLTESAEDGKTAGPVMIDLLCFDGSPASCLAWVIKNDGHLQADFVEVTEWSKNTKALETEKYVKVLSESYSDIFEFDYSARTVRAVFSQRSAMLRWIKDIPMQMKDATERWILHKVSEEDKQKLREFWENNPAELPDDSKDIYYNVMSSDGSLWQYFGRFIVLDENTSLFCCRKNLVPETAAAKPYSGPVVQIRTFGYFDVFVNDTPIPFRNEKSKELLALLVDRKGGYVTSEEAIGFLWEDAPADSLTLARYRKVALRLKNTLEEYGISGIIESVNGKRRIVPERVQCDLYDYISGKEAYAGLFKGSYLTNYSWAENTLAELL